MNYLSHFYVDHIPDNHYYNAALILPDITKRWVKTFKQPAPSSQFSESQFQLLAGCLKHYRSDQQFHASSFFEHYQDTINRALKKVPFSNAVHRKWFIAHILTELLIDRQLVNLHPTVVDAFYHSLSEVKMEELLPFLTFYGMAETADFVTFFNHFREVKYIYYYADNNKFLYSLNRIMMRVGIAELNATDSGLLLDVILSIEQTYMPEPATLLNELKGVFTI